MVLDVTVAHAIEYVASPFLTSVFVAITSLGDWYVIVSLYIVIASYYFATKRIHVVRLLTALMLSTVVVFILKELVARERPEIFRITDDIFTSNAFPSAHAAVSMAFYGYLAFLLLKDVVRPALRLTVIAFTTLLIFTIGLSRIYLGVHWTTDVLAGWLLGLCILIPLVIVSKRYVRSGAFRPTLPGKKRPSRT